MKNRNKIDRYFEEDEFRFRLNDEIKRTVSSGSTTEKVEKNNLTLSNQI